MNVQWLIRKTWIQLSSEEPKYIHFFLVESSRLSEQWLRGRFSRQLFLPVRFTIQRGQLRRVSLVREHRNRMRSACAREWKIEIQSRAEGGCVPRETEWEGSGDTFCAYKQTFVSYTTINTPNVCVCWKTHSQPLIRSQRQTPSTRCWGRDTFLIPEGQLNPKMVNVLSSVEHKRQIFD